MSKIVRKIVQTASAPKPVGPYSQAVIVDKTMYISGQLGLDPSSGELVSGGIEAQAEQMLKNMQAVLKAAKLDMTNVVKTTILLKDIADWPKVNTVYAKYFTTRHPARAAYQVAALPRAAMVEMEAVAVVGEMTEG